MNQGDENIRASRDLLRALGPQVTGIGRGPRVFPGGGQVTEPGHGILPGKASGRRNTIGLKINQTIKSRTNSRTYVVESEEIAGCKGGQAEVIRCRCEDTGEQVAIKFYLGGREPKPEIANELLARRHPNVINVLDIGEWENELKNYFYYEVLEYCAGGSLMDLMPLNEDQVTSYLRVIVDGLEHLHSHGTLSIVHRDIKPSNLLFRSEARRPDELVIADFGISSIRAGDEDGEENFARTTATSGQFTPDYVAPELGKGKVACNSDYYSLGMTLLHCLLPKEYISPMDLWPPDLMRDAHKSGLVLRLLRNPDEVMPVWEKLDPPCRPWNASALRYLHDTVILRSPRLKKLFNGILQVNTEYRWGPRQVRNWLDKEEILTSDNKKLWREERYPGKEIPYPRKMFGTLVKKPDHLAALVDDPAFRDTIYSDLGNTLLNWASMFSGELKDRLEALCQDHGSEKDLALFKLQFILDPSLPLVIGLKSINTFDDFSRRILEADDEQSLIALEEGLWKEKFEGWIDAVCGNKLNVSTNKNGTKEILSFLKRLRAGTNRNRRLAVWELRWYFFSKTIPFPFMNKRAETPQALVKMIDRDESSRKEGIRLMNEGWIGAWLFYRFGDDSPEFRDQNNLVAGKNSDRAKLEALLHILDVDLEWALPEAKPEKFNFGKIAYDSNKSVNIRFQNKLRGYWESDILLRPKSSRGFELSLSTVTQGDLVTLTARPGSLPVGKSHRAKVVVSYFFGKERTELCVPVSFRVAAPVWKMAGRSFLIAVVFGAILGGLRYCMNYAHELNAFQTLNWMPWSAVANLNWKVMKHIGGIEWVLIGIALLFAGTIGYGFIRLRAQSQIRR